MIRKLIATTFVAAIVLSSQVALADSEGPYVEGTVDTTSIVEMVTNTAEGDGVLGEVQIGSVMDGELYGDAYINATVSGVENYAGGDDVEASVTLGGFGE